MKKSLLAVLPICMLMLSGCSSQKTTVCTVPDSSTDIGSTTLEVIFTSKNDNVKTVKHLSTTPLGDEIEISQKEFKEAAKELKKNYKNFKGLKYNYEYDKKTKEIVETIEVDCSKADQDTFTLVGLSIDEKDIKANKSIEINLKESVKSMESFGLKCKTK